VSSKSPRRGASPPRPLRAPASACDSPWGQDTIRQIKFWLTHKDAPGFSIRVRAQRFYPDMFYVNEFAERLKLHDSEVFEKLFA